jgi:hypothetical protein
MRPGRTAAGPVWLPLSFKASVKSPREAWRAGMSPNTMPVVSEMRMVKGSPVRSDPQLRSLLFALEHSRKWDSCPADAFQGYAPAPSVRLCSISNLIAPHAGRPGRIIRPWPVAPCLAPGHQIYPYLLRGMEILRPTTSGAPILLTFRCGWQENDPLLIDRSEAFLDLAGKTQV